MAPTPVTVLSAGECRDEEMRPPKAVDVAVADGHHTMHGVGGGNEGSMVESFDSEDDDGCPRVVDLGTAQVEGMHGSKWKSPGTVVTAEKLQRALDEERAPKVASEESLRAEMHALSAKSELQVSQSCYLEAQV